MPRYTTNGLPREQGATRRVSRTLVIPDNDNTMGPVRRTGISSPKPLPKVFGRRINTPRPVRSLRQEVLKEAIKLGVDAFDLGVLPEDFDKLFDPLALIEHLREVGRDFGYHPGELVPADPNPPPDMLTDHGWNYSANWPTSAGIAATYDTILEYRLNPTASVSNVNTPAAAGGTVLPVGDWSVATYPVDFVTAVVQGSRPADAYFVDGLAYATQGEAWPDPDATNPFDPVLTPGYWRRFNLWPAISPNISKNLETQPDVVFESQVDREQVTERVFDSSARQRHPSRRKPPREDEKEKKYKTRSAQLLKKIFDALDAVSENAELVDVFYEALPPEVRKDYEASLGFQWKQGRGGKWYWAKPDGLERGLLDNAGQYGIDGADWKAAALWQYWDQVDAEVAFTGLINNQTQDFVYGQVYKGLPANVGHSLDPGFEGIEELLKRYIYQ